MTKKTTRRFLLLVGLALSLAIGRGIYLFNKPRRDISLQIPNFRIMAKELSDFYTANEDRADAKYLGKVLEVEGNVVFQKISSSHENIITLQGNDSSAVVCNLSEHDTIESPGLGELVTIKGICVGYLTDVNLKECVIIKRSEK